MLRSRPLRRLLPALLLLLALVPPSADAAPNITLGVDAQRQVLLGRQAINTLTATNPAGQPAGYNLSFRDVLPVGVSYVAGSATFAGSPVEPTVLANAPAAGQTTLLWRNVGDLSPNSSGALTYRVAHATTGTGARTVGDTYTSGGVGAYISDDPRTVPAFGATGLPTTGATGSATGTYSTSLSGISMDVQEGSPEGELLRGAHDHQTTYTLRLEDNAVNATGPLDVNAYLAAGLEFLGCGNEDNTTNAPTNPGSTQEYPGSGPLSGRTASPSGCTPPTAVTTETLDPDGAGPLPAAVYTHLFWDDLPALAANATRDLRFVAAVPLRANTAPFTAANQTANLDNNGGARTQDEQGLPVFARVTGRYNAAVDTAAEDTETRTAEDLRILKSAGQSSIADGQLTRWTLRLDTGEYRFVDNLRVTDTVPDGLCPLDATNLESDRTADCDPGTPPSVAYTSAVESASGTWTLRWDQSTDPALARLQPSSTHTIAFSTRSRPFYQQNFVDERRVLARDSWSNAVSVLGADFQRCSDVPDCDPTGTKIDTSPGLPPDPDPDGTDDGDSSSAGQSAGAPGIDKTIRAATAVVPADCSGAAYGDTNPLYGPGDRVCFKLRVDFPELLNTGAPRITDLLPSGVTFESYAPTAANTVAITGATGAPGVPVAVGDRTVTFALGNASGNATNAQVFEVIVAGRVTDATQGLAADVKGNLMKFTFTDSSGRSFPLRDQADFTWAEPQLTLLEGVNDVNGGPANGPNVDNVSVRPGDAVTIRVDLTNGGNRDATNATVLERLPTGVSCASVTAGSISDGGTCSGTTITWTGVNVAANAAKKLTYTYAVPSGGAPGSVFLHTAGVRDYQSATNAGGAYTLFPANNIDPAVTQATAASARDTTSVRTADPTVTYTSVSDDISQSGNAGPNSTNATIGERITYTARAVIPNGERLQDTAGPATFTIPVGAKQTLLGTPDVTLNGNPLPAGFTVTTAANTIRVTLPPNFLTPGTGVDTLQVVYRATVDNIPANTRLTGSQSITTTATLAYADPLGVAKAPNQSTTQTIVEPNVTLAKSNSDTDGRVSPTQRYTYTLRVTNPATPGRVSTANDVVVTDKVPLGLTPVTAAGTPVANGGAVQPTAGGTWDATNRVITYPLATVAPGSTATLSYEVRVDSPALGNAVKTNTAQADSTSYPSTATLYGTERTATNAAGTTYYRAAAQNTVLLFGVALTKAVDLATATIGESRTFTINATIPANLDLSDITIRDVLPDGMDFEAGSATATCVSAGCTIAPTPLPATANADGSTLLGFFVGDVANAPADRIVRITYRAHPDDRYEPEATNVVRGDTLINTATAFSNQVNTIVGTPTSTPDPAAFSDRSPDRTATVTVTEPALSVDKQASKTTAQPGDTLTYTVKVANTGNATAHDVTVTDQPDAELVGVSPAAGVSTTALVDGWTAADPDLRWVLSTIPAGTTVTLTYTASPAPSAQLSEADQAVNTAAVPTAYGRPAAEREANGFDYRTYSGGQDTETVAIDLPRLAVSLTTGAAGNPESANAEIGQPFPWRAVVSNTSPTANARDVDLTVRLPRNWTYTPGTASIGAPTVTIDPVNGDLLTWANFTDLGPGASRTVTFSATPDPAARIDAGVGATNPHIARARVTGDDATGASASKDGPYAAGPDPAQAILLAPVLTIAKTPDNGTVTAGTAGAWTIAVGNTGTGTARTVRVTDTLPAGVGYTAGSASSANPGFGEVSNTLNGDGTRTLEFRLADLAPAATASISLPVTVPATDANGTRYVNSATIRADEQPSGPTDTGSLDVVTRADMAVTKTPDATRFVAGRTVAWTLEATNRGPSVARDATLADTVPGTVGGLALSGDDAGDCTLAGQALSCSFGDLPPGARRTVVVTGTLADRATGAVDNTARVDTDTTDPEGTNDEATASTPVDEVADLEVTKTAEPTLVVQGSNVVYTLRVENHGPSVARASQLTDTLPAGTTYVSDDAGCSHAAGTVTCALGTLAVDEVLVVRVTAKVVTTGTKRNTATVSTSATDPVPDNDTSSADVDVDPAADLAITKTGDATVAAGGIITYTLRASNNGPSDATDVEISDVLPDGTSLVSFDAPAGWDCTGTATVRCTRPVFANGATASFSVELRAGFGVAAGPVTNRVTIGGRETDPDTTDNADDATTTVGPASDLKLTKSAAPASVPQTGRVTYTLRVENLGGQDDTGVTVTDTLPAGVSYLSDDAGCSYAAGTVTCPVGPLARGASRTIAVTVRADDAGTLVNTARVDGDNPDPDAGNNADDAEITVAEAVDLRLDKRGPATVAAGGTATFELEVVNDGPAAATGVQVTDTLPSGLDYVSDDGGCSHASGVVTCPVGGLAEGDARTISIVVSAPYAAADQTLTNRARATADQTELDPANNDDSVDVRVGSAADLRIDKTVDPAAVRQGEQAVYTLRVDNDGPSAAADVVVTDALPAGVAFVSAAGCTQAGGTVTCRLGTLAKGDFEIVTIVVRGAATGLQSNTARVTSTTDDPDPGNNESSVDLGVGPTADLQVEKTGPATVAVGDTVTYDLAVTNNGPSDATDVSLVDTLPPGLTFVDATEEQGSHAVAGSEVTFSLGTIPVDATVRMTVTARAGFSVAGTTAINSATASADQFDPEPDDNTDDHPVTVGPAADVSVVKTGPASVPAGGTAVYTLQVANGGPQAATGVTVEDALPEGLTPVSATPTQGACAPSGATIRCALGTLAAGAGAQVVIAARVDASRAGSDIRNVASVTANEPDPNLSNNADDAVTRAVTAPASQPQGQPDLRLRKTADPGPVVVGRRHGFTITATNDSDVAATGVVVVDRPLDALRIVSMKAEQGTCSVRRKRCDLGTVAGRQSVRIRVLAVPEQAGGVSNSASVTSDSGEGDAESNVDQTKVRVQAPHTRFRMRKRAVERSVAAGARVRYVLRVRNVGGDTATEVRVCDVPPHGMSFVRVPGARLSRGRACWTFPSWKAGVVRSLRVVARVNRTMRGRMVNRATLTAANADRRRAEAVVRVRPAAPDIGGGVTG